MLKYNEYITEAKKAVKYPFIQAAARGNNNKVKELIKNDNKLDINMRDEDGRTALMNAAINRYLMVVTTLVDDGADVNLQDKLNRTALMMSSTLKITDKLLDAGADVNILNCDGKTAIMEYLNYNERNLITLIEKFLQKGLNLDIKDYSGKNFYDLIKEKQVNAKYRQNELDLLISIEQYMNEKFPQYKEEWELKQATDKYNM